jgi:hypothetical protein
VTRYFCTYFDRNYFVRGLAMYRSLRRHAPDVVLWVLCLDEETRDAIDRLRDDRLRAVPLSELEAWNRALLEAKANRTRIEYYFTLSPAWPRFLLERHPDVDVITYVDADLLFFASPEPIYAELGGDSVLIIGHRFPEHLRHHELYGIFNVGLIAFRNDRIGRDVLAEWGAQCIEWCYDRVEGDRFADQKYLDRWPGRPGVHVLRHEGAGVSPWNWSRYRFEFSNGRGTVDGVPLIFYHFHGFKLANRWLYQPGEVGYDMMPARLRRPLYSAYLRELAATRRWLRKALPGFDASPSGSVRYPDHTFEDILAGLRRGELHLRTDLLSR